MTHDPITAGLTELLDATLPEADLLARTVRLAEEYGAAGQPPFVAAVVRDGRVIGVGANRILIDADPAAHGEVEAIRDAGRRAGLAALTGAVVISSCEPCAICRTVAAAAGVTEIVYAAGRELVPAEIDANPERTGALMDAVAELVPGIARAGQAGLPPEQLAAPFAAYLRALG
ncbi:deaminase [Microlunatus sp. GCM10028923]|uniref:deaminase n=1 Tax=Microlunatus sp. GCM10028923 TaxID=3273400 RepID=UPI00361471C4